MKNNKTQSFYYPELDSLRFIAFLLVFIHNAPYDTGNTFWKLLHEYGWIGVDLFYCLSAFLITKLLVLEHQQTGSINVKFFYFRRILRIWPLYFIYIACALFFIIQDQGWNDNILKHVVGLFTFTYNFVYLFLTYKIYFVLVHLWTISYEEQFYFVIPWIIRKSMVSKRYFGYIFLIIAFLVGMVFRALFIYNQVKHPAIYMLPFTHFEAVLGGIGIGLGFFDQMIVKVRGWILLFYGILCITAVFLLPNIYEISWKLMLTYPLSGMGMVSIIYTIIYKDGSIISNLLNNKTMAYLGKISYGLYIYHILSLSIVSEVAIRIFKISPSQQLFYPILIFICGFSLTISLSIISYNWIEKSFLKYKQQFGAIKSRPI